MTGAVGVRHKKVFILAALVLSAILLVGSGWLLSRARTFQVFGELIARVDTQQKVVALTFDDGPSQLGVDEVLPLLRDRGVKATFFLIGGALERNPRLGQSIAADGHEIGNHTYTHQRMVLKSPAFIEMEVERTDQRIRATGYGGPIHFRPPYGKKLIGLPWYLSRTGRRTIMWDVEPESYPEVAASVEQIVEHVVSSVQPGSIILLHPMARSGGNTRAALPMVIDRLHQAQYRFVTVSEMLLLQSPDDRMQ